MRRRSHDLGLQPPDLVKHFATRLAAEVDAATVVRWLEDARRGDGFVLVDVRTPERYHHGHVKGAVNVPLDDVEDRAGELPADKEVLVYDEDEGDLSSARAALRLAQAGRRVRDVPGGFRWLVHHGAATVASDEPEGGDTASRGWMNPPTETR